MSSIDIGKLRFGKADIALIAEVISLHQKNQDY